MARTEERWWSLALGPSLLRLTALALAGLIAMQVVYWIVVHPVNRVWLKGEPLGRVGFGFFRLGGARAGSEATPQEWTNLRNRWEYGHVARAGLAAMSFVALVIAISL